MPTMNLIKNRNFAVKNLPKILETTLRKAKINFSGSSLSALLFTVYTSSLPRTSEEVDIVLYANNLAVLVRDQTLRTGSETTMMRWQWSPIGCTQMGKCTYVRRHSLIVLLPPLLYNAYTVVSYPFRSICRFSMVISSTAKPWKVTRYLHLHTHWNLYFV